MSYIDVLETELDTLQNQLDELSTLVANNLIKDYPSKVLSKFYQLSLFRFGIFNFIDRVFSLHNGFVSASYQIFLQDLVDTIYTDRKVNFKKYSYMLQTNTNNLGAHTQQQQPTKILKIDDYKSNPMCPSAEFLTILTKCGPAGALAIVRLILQYERGL